MTPSPHLADLVDLERLQRLLEGLSAATGVSLSIIEPDGTILAAASWQDICTQFHRAHETTRAACLDYDDAVLRDRFPAGVEGSGTMRCPNGLCGFALPLIVGGDHLATVFASQFFYEDEPVDRDAFRKRARELGFDDDAYLDAVDRVPVLSHGRVERTVDLLGGFVGSSPTSASAPSSGGARRTRCARARSGTGSSSRRSRMQCSSSTTRPAVSWRPTPRRRPCTATTATSC